ncbi:DUF6461 domain-containing protein [Streptomyces sp. NPDC048483]|uniref:DUF6461 domain-containing protein n=1 Tax=Streptomyces sp. NPDC048483 TaxID=3154927 RepID=UPI00343D80F6
MDLTGMFGEGWAITLAHHRLGTALHHMGVPDPRTLPDAFNQAAYHAQNGDLDDGVLLLGRTLPDGWSLILELDGRTGWTGIASEVLTGLSADGNTAFTACRTPDDLDMYIAHDGAEIAELDLVSAAFPQGADTTHPLIAALTAVGFDASDDLTPTGEAAEDHDDMGLALAIRALTGLNLTTHDLTPPFIGGFTHIRP